MWAEQTGGKRQGVALRMSLSGRREVVPFVRWQLQTEPTKTSAAQLVRAPIAHC